MNQTILDGSALAKEIETRLADRVRAVASRLGFAPALATILVGNDPSSEIYVNMKGNACRRVGIEPRKIALPATTTTGELLGVIDALNADRAVFGILLQHPVAALLLNANATVTVCHSKTENLPEIIREADLLVAAVGKPEFVKADWIREGCVIVDAGYHPGKIGDVEKAAFAKACAYTPVPGGVGPMTISTLISQTVIAAERSIS
jgi:5,10-methylene-tetrahydrofolate dehydrogenase/methenyl tetrahydrofolate cyclohydrolase